MGSGMFDFFHKVGTFCDWITGSKKREKIRIKLGSNGSALRCEIPPGYSDTERVMIKQQIAVYDMKARGVYGGDINYSYVGGVHGAMIGSFIW